MAPLLLQGWHPFFVTTLCICGHYQKGYCIQKERIYKSVGRKWQSCRNLREGAVVHRKIDPSNVWQSIKTTLIIIKINCFHQRLWQKKTCGMLQLCVIRFCLDKIPDLHCYLWWEPLCSESLLLVLVYLLQAQRYATSERIVKRSTAANCKRSTVDVIRGWMFIRSQPYASVQYLIRHQYLYGQGKTLEMFELSIFKFEGRI